MNYPDLPMPDQSYSNRIEQELQISEARFHVLFETSALGICIVGSDQKVIDVNPALCRMIRNTCEEMKAMRFEDLIHLQDAALERDSYSQMTGGGIPFYNVETPIVRKDNTLFWGRITYSVVRTRDEKPVFSVVLVEDIDEQRLISSELQQSEARFRAMFENAAVGIGVMSLDRTILDANPAMCRMLGLARDELIGNSPIIATYPEDFPQSTQEYYELITGKRNYYWSERRYVRKNGEVFWAHVTMSVVRDAKDQPIYLVGMVIDIDDRKRVLQELRESEARFRAIFDNTSVGMALMTLDRRIVAVNQAAERIVGYSEEDLTKIDPAELSHPEDRQIGMAEFREMASGQRPGFQMEKRYVVKMAGLFGRGLPIRLCRIYMANPNTWLV